MKKTSSYSQLFFKYNIVLIYSQFYFQTGTVLPQKLTYCVKKGKKRYPDFCALYFYLFGWNQNVHTEANPQKIKKILFYRFYYNKNL